MGMITRSQFSKMFEDATGMCSIDSPLWIPERRAPNKPKELVSQWFVCVRPLLMYSALTVKDEYWEWCKEHMKGEVRCYSSTGGGPDDPDQKEWWGFTHLEDVFWWRLRWE
jgi:hypothetical protein